MKADRWDEFTLQELELLRHVQDCSHIQGYYTARLVDELVTQIDKTIERRRRGGEE